MRKQSILLAFLIITSVGSCTKDRAVSYDVIERELGLPKVSEASENGRKISTAMNVMGFELFKLVSKKAGAEDPGKNLFTSPLSISTALGMTWNGAIGQTETQMRDVLGYAEMSQLDILEGYQNLLGFLATNDSDIIVEYANSIWFDDSWQTVQTYVDQSLRYYDAAIGRITCQSLDAPKQINAWIEDKTHGLINNMLSENITLPPRCVMLVNTLYFLADWEKDFDADSTRKEPFTTQDGQELDVDMMRRGFLAKYHEDERFQAISIPYKGGRFAWTGLLPKPGSGASDLVEWLSGETWESLAANMKYAECDLKLPRFKIEFGTEEMKDYLKEMGMVVPFDAFAADFSGMTVRGEDLYIYTVLHKSYIEVDEEGTEAAAATVVGMDAGASAPVDMHTVRFDHPFVFIIHDTQTNTVLFHGQFNKPL